MGELTAVREVCSTSVGRRKRRKIIIADYMKSFTSVTKLKQNLSILISVFQFLHTIIIINCKNGVEKLILRCSPTLFNCHFVTVTWEVLRSALSRTISLFTKIYLVRDRYIGLLPVELIKPFPYALMFFIYSFLYFSFYIQ